MREDLLQELVEDYTTGKQQSLMQMKKGQLTKEGFLEETKRHIDMYYVLPPEQARKLLEAFERYIFGYSRLSVLIDDKSVSDIRVVAHNNIRVKRKGRRMEAGVAFSSPEEYRQFID